MRFLVSFALSIAFAPVILAADSTPLNCEMQLADIRAACESVEATALQGNAAQLGRPVPSREVVRLPAHGTAKAKKWGFSCISGVAMRRLPNGWQQLRTRDYQHIRCQDL